MLQFSYISRAIKKYNGTCERMEQYMSSSLHYNYITWTFNIK